MHVCEWTNERYVYNIMQSNAKIKASNNRKLKNQNTFKAWAANAGLWVGLH